MVTVIRWLAAAVLFIGAPVGLASPAAADQPMEGSYTYSEPGRPQATWTFSPTCVPVCPVSSPECTRPFGAGGPSGCTLHMSSATAAQVNRDEREMNFGGTARIVNGMWGLTTPKPEGVQCPDGSYALSTDTYAFDDASLSGTHTVTWTPQCGMAAGMTKTPFTLAFIAPLPAPVTRYPLQCNQFGVCR
ncbi:hypothetical protein ACTXG7_18370 [Mycolicibacterium sp. Dal123E01]|uniref:hypothetical protein n=1 Tax=Mycolicibacterium sp. Dal123E01 TaxID=3457578 RepID=UPI00403EBB83